MTAALGDKVLNSALGAIPLGRAGKARTWLRRSASSPFPEAGYITGCVLQIDGGMGA